jgi:hypothetical protein
MVELGGAVSLTVSPELMEKAQHGSVPEDEFIDCIRASLPYAWAMVERLAKELEASGAPSVQNVEIPPDDASWGQVLLAAASDEDDGVTFADDIR